MASVPLDAATDCIRHYSWKADIQSVIQALKPTIVLSEAGQPKFGQSKFRGLPDIPDNMILDIGREDNFLFQLNFSEIAPFDSQSLLPTEGMLYAFLKGLQSNGAYPDAKEDLKLIYIPESIQSNRSTDGKRMSFEISHTLPGYKSAAYEKLNLGEDFDTLQKVARSIQEIDGSDDYSSNLLGHPQQTQYNPWFYHFRQNIWKLHGRAPSDPEKYKVWNEKYESEMKALNDSHVLLYQGATPFKSLAILYIGISKEDLANRNFSAAFYDIQST
ncbi:DUF1963 domain-containing protein [Xanthocytophaga flava]|uniref:DUF1963 domain-containing protein n=1 Tax=Xanthocytophaga flava TaxID=3048013 RepID=UPI0028D82153|nr:DUF1963 domain-containing protein [Xanthocytophaga flavus]MDJ1472108.1 DUF1963 domain-containing protein [Xanthocytophaga flavus]